MKPARNYQGKYTRTNWLAFNLLVLSLILSWLALQFGEHYEIKAIMKSPASDAIVIERPVEVEKIKEVPVPAVENNILSMVDYIWLKESSRGKNTNPQALHNYCKSIGRSNEFGLGGMQLKLCFETHKQAKAMVTLWLAEHLKTFNGDVSMSLCYYRYGEKLSDCDYVAGFNSLQQ